MRRGERGEGCTSGQPQQEHSRVQMQPGDGDGRAGRAAALVGNRDKSKQKKLWERTKEEEHKQGWRGWRCNLKKSNRNPCPNNTDVITSAP